MSGYKLFYLIVFQLVLFISFIISYNVSLDRKNEILIVWITLVIIICLIVYFTKDRHYLRYYFRFYSDEKEPDYFLIYSAKIVSLDNHFSEKERKKIKSYLKEDYGENGTLKYRNLLVMIEEIDWVFGNFQTPGDKYRRIDRLRLLKRIVGLALTDRFLSKKELIFIQETTNRFGLRPSDLKVIFGYYNYVSEEDMKRQRTIYSKSNFSTQKSLRVLGLDSDASLADVKSAYRELAKLFHPDKQRGTQRNKELAKQQFLAITNAYNILKEKLA